MPIEIGEEVPEIGQLAEFDLYLQAEFPKALKIYGEVTDNRLKNIWEEGGKQTCPGIALSFIGTNLGVEALLEKYIFRHHRRSVAQQKSLSVSKKGEVS